MKIVGVTACTAGIAHTYLEKEKLVKAARDLGHEIKIETQGSIGTECELTAEDVAGADVELPMKVVLNSPKGVLNKIEEKLKGAE